MNVIVYICFAIIYYCFLILQMWKNEIESDMSHAKACKKVKQKLEPTDPVFGSCVKQ